MGKTEWIKNLATNVKAKREKDLKISQEKLAQRSGLSSSIISRVERGVMENPTFDTLECLAKGLGEDGLSLLKRSGLNKRKQN